KGRLYKARVNPLGRPADAENSAAARSSSGDTAVMDNADLVSPQFLAHRLRRVLRLLRTHEEDIRTAAVGDVRADRAAFNPVLLCAKLSRNGHLEGEEGVDALLDQAEARLRSDAMVASLVWRPGHVPCLAMATTLLNELGRGDPRCD